MKFRATTNSIRIRVRKSDLEQLKTADSVYEEVNFPGGGKWSFGLLINENQLLASSNDLLRTDTADAWAMAKFNERGQDHLQDFLDAVRTRRPTLAPCEGAQRAASIGHLGILALNSGRPISWRPKTESVFEDPTTASLLEIPMREPWMLHD